MASSEAETALQHLSTKVGEDALQEAILVAKLTTAREEVQEWKQRFLDLQERVSVEETEGNVVVGEVAHEEGPEDPA